MLIFTLNLTPGFALLSQHRLKCQFFASAVFSGSRVSWKGITSEFLSSTLNTRPISAIPHTSNIIYHVERDFKLPVFIVPCLSAVIGYFATSVRTCR